MPALTEDKGADFVEQVKTLSIKVDHIKSSLYQGIHKEYTDFYSGTQQELSKSIKPILKEIQTLEDKFENQIKTQLSSATSLHNDLLGEYEKIKHVTKLMQILCDCNRELEACKSTDNEKFVSRANHLRVVKELLDSLSPTSSGCNVKIFKVLRREYIDSHKKIINDIGDAWTCLLVWTVSTSASWNSADVHLKTSLKVNPLPNDMDVIDLFQGMEVLNIFNEKLKQLANHFFVYFLKPLTKFKVLLPNIQNVNDVLTLSIVKKVENYKLQKPAHHVLIYEKIVDVVRFLRTLFNEAYSNENCTLDPVGLIGSFIWDDMSNMIISDHLSADVPTSKSQMEKYEPIYEETRKFECSLIEEGFIPEGTDKLSKYISDASIQFSNRICQDILSCAHEIMLYDIHNLVSVEPCLDRAAITPELEEKRMSKAVKHMFTNNETIDEGFLQADMFTFPFCNISDPVQKLSDFIYQKMVLATESPYPIASQIFHSCRDIFELFVNVVPVYHKEALKLPQLAGVHYNNCMYLAHQCTTLGHQFRSSLPEQLQGAITTFIDYVPVLRRCGTAVFSAQLQTQKQELLTMLETCNNFTESAKKDGITKIEKTFNQIVYHLKRLAKQWNGILAQNIFNKSIAALINTVFENILSSIFRMEDISAEEAGQIHVAFGILIEHIPEIVQEDSSNKDVAGGDQSIYDHIRSWQKFNHLRGMLDSSLLEISNLWDGGSGELASCMTEGEVRGLIRALFQNTDQRSKVLAKIKPKSDNS